MRASRAPLGSDVEHIRTLSANMAILRGRTLKERKEEEGGLFRELDAPRLLSSLRLSPSSYRRLSPRGFQKKICQIPPEVYIEQHHVCHHIKKRTPERLREANLIVLLKFALTPSRVFSEAWSSRESLQARSSRLQNRQVGPSEK